MKLSLLFIKLFVISALLIVSNHNLALRDPDARSAFVDYYTVWLAGIFDQGVYITGYVVNADWLPKDANSTEVRPLIPRSFVKER